MLLIWTARLLEDAGQHAMGPHLQAIVRAVPTLRPLRLGDGGLGRFHGGGAGLGAAHRPGAGRAAADDAAEAAAADGLRPADGRPGHGAARRRAAAGRGDAGARRHARLRDERRARAAGGQRRPGPRLRRRLGAARARRPPAHSTVEVDGRSSARLVAAGLAARTFGPRLIDGPDARLGAAGAGRHRAVAARDAGRLRREPRPPARAAALRRRARAGAARRGHPDAWPTPAPATSSSGAPRGRAARLRGALPPAPGGAAELDPGRQIVLLTLGSRRGLAVPRRRRRRSSSRSRSTSTPGARGAAADDAGGCPRRGGRVSRPGHLVDRPHRRAPT